MSSAAIELHGITKAFRRREREAGAPWWRREWKDKVALHELNLVIEAGGVSNVPRMRAAPPSSAGTSSTSRFQCAGT